MARIKKAPLGFVSGKLGDVVFRIMNEQKFVSLAPKKYKISQSSEAKKGRANFAAVVKFAKTINSITQLKEVWTSAKVAGTNSYHRIIRYNGKLVNSGSLTDANKITPEGLLLELSSISIQEDKLDLIISFSSDKLNFPATLSIVFCFNSNMVLKQTATIETPAPGDLYSLSLPLDYYVKESLKEFPNPLVYLAITGVKENNKEVFWTSTAARQL